MRDVMNFWLTNLGVHLFFLNFAAEDNETSND